MKKRNRRIVCFTALCFAAVLIVSGCKKNNENDIDNPPVNITPSAQATPEIDEKTTPTLSPSPSPTPMPTPIVDMPVDRVAIPERTAEAEVPVVITAEAIRGNLNPFYAESEIDREITALTQLKLICTDDAGNAVGGTDYPCFAYSVEKMADNSAFSESGINPDNYETYRITLKKGICFADGTPVSVDDVLFSIYTLTDRLYDGPATLSALDIYGMEQYHSQVSDDVRKTAEFYAECGINEDGTMPEGVDNPDEWQAVWSHMDEAGIAFTEELIDMINNEYCIDSYVQAFLSPSLTHKHIEASRDLQVLFAMKVWGFVDKYDYYKSTVRDNIGNVYDLNTQELTAEIFWENIKSKHGYDLSGVEGLNYERPYEDKYFEDYVAEAYCAANLGVENIAGIAKGSTEFDDGAVRDAIYVLISKDADIAEFNFYVAEKSFYEGNERNLILHGAGEYILTMHDESGCILEANDNYLLGGPELKTINYMIEREETEDNEMD